MSKRMMKKAMVGVIRKLFLYSKGVPMGKPDKKKLIPKIDDDVRPLTICDSVIRILDNIVNQNVMPADRDNAMGPYQVVGKKKAAEIATEAVNKATTIMALDDTISGLTIDAINAFGNVCRGGLYGLVRRKLHDVLQWYIFVYGESIMVQFDAIHFFEMC